MNPPYSIVSATRHVTLKVLRLSLATLIVVSAGNWSTLTCADELPNDIRAALQATAQACDPLTVEWKSSVSTQIDRHEFAANFENEEDALHFLTQEITDRFIIQDKCVYERWYSKVSGRPPLIRETSFDLEFYYQGNGKFAASRGDSPRLNIDRPIDRMKRIGVDANLFDTRYFDSVGVRCPHRFSLLGKGPASLILQQADTAQDISVRSELLEGRECTLVEVRPPSGETTRYFLDPKRHYSVLRIESVTKEGKVTKQTVNDDFVELEGTQVLVPKRSTSTFFSAPTSTGSVSGHSYTTTLLVSELSTARVPKESFTLKYDLPGTTILDGTLPESAEKLSGWIEYRIPANPEDLEDVIAAAVLNKPYVPRARRWLIAINIAIAFALSTYVLAQYFPHRFRRIRATFDAIFSRNECSRRA